MADATFNTPSGQAIKRELFVLYLNTGTSAAPVWSAIGKRVADSSMEIDWSAETNTDILGNVFTDAKKPVKTQSFDPYPLDAGDAAAVKLWNQGIKDEDYTALTAQDVLVVHMYAGTANTAMEAVRYSGAAVLPTGLGGEGGGTLSMPLQVTYGGTRTPGAAALSDGVVTFTPA